MKKITAYRLKSEKKGNSSETTPIIQSKLHDIQSHLHVMLLEVELLCQNKTAVLNSQVILNYLERVDKSLQFSRGQFSMDASIRREEQVGKALNSKKDKRLFTSARRLALGRYPTDKKTGNGGKIINP